MFVLGILAVITALGLPIGLLVAFFRMRADVERLKLRVEWLSTAVGRERRPAAPDPLEELFPAANTPIAAPWVGVAGATPSPVPLPALPPTPARRARPDANLEQLIGGVWLQNIGSVLLLVGLFLMILWGYNSGRLGPGVLVGAGVTLGLALVWRGDRVARSVAPFGHALIGVGLGVVYLTLYLGHVRLHVLPAWAAFILLALVSCGSALAGLRYRVQLIAALGVIGAFIPILMAAWLPLAGLWLSPPGLLAYLAIINLFVIVLAVRAGWSALGIAGCVMAAATWIWSFHTASWGWGIEGGLAVLFTALGLAPLPRLVSVEGRVRPIDLAVIALAPLCLLAASSPFLAYAGRSQVAMLFITLAIVHLLAVLWVDARRPERDLWRPLSAAAILFLTAALERGLGTERTPVAWCIEGVGLLALGVSGRGGGWLRFWGSLVLGIAALWMFSGLLDMPWNPSQLPVLYGGSIRSLICIGALLAGGFVLARHRDRLSDAERWTPEFWTVAGNLLLGAWIGIEAGHLARVMTGAGGRFAYLLPVGVNVEARREGLQFAMSESGWMAQAAVIAMIAPVRSGAFLRVFAAAAGGCAMVCGLIALSIADGWGPDQIVALYPAGLLGLAAILAAGAVSYRLAIRRTGAGSAQDWIPELWALASNVLLMLWSRREAVHVAMTWMAGDPQGPRVSTAASALASGAWIVQAVALLSAGWISGSAFLRWCGLSLIGLTVIKFLIVDLQTVDVFWRFVTALAAGAAMMAISFNYRKRMQARHMDDGGEAGE